MSDTEAERFEAYRPLLFGIAYRMLGSVSEAEDIVQDCYLRYQAVPAAQIGSHKALLTTIVTRLCLNQLQTAQRQRETYVGPWLPEPLLTGAEARTPLEQVELHESLALAFLVVLEQLTPSERAAFLLHEVFGYRYAEIAVMVEKDAATCRQLVRRAKQHLVARRPRFQASAEAHERLLTQFVRAVSSGDLSGLLGLLSDEIVLWADSGGQGRGALAGPLVGRPAVSRFFLASPRFRAQSYQGEIASVNGAPALLLRSGGKVQFVLAISITAEQIEAVYVIGNAAKLGSVNGSA